MAEFKIDPTDQFLHLQQAPIVEAVIDWRARGDKPFDREVLREYLRKELPDYPGIRPQHEVELEARLRPEGTAQSQRSYWHGFRLESKNQPLTAHFTRDGLTFSRTAPYDEWDRFATEAKRLWKVYVGFVNPATIDRLGVRFINRLPIELDKLEQVLELSPACPSTFELPIEGFLHRTTFGVPGHPYRVKVVQASQPPTPTGPSVTSVIVDIDVFTTTHTDLGDENVTHRLAEMRWLKNKAFYSLLTPQTIERFRESKV